MLSGLAYAQFTSTQLRLTILNDLGNLESGVEVLLFESEEDFNNNKPCTPMQKTDEKGRVKFKGLKSIPYYIEAKKGTKSNLFGGEKTEKLEENKVNKVNLVISG